MGVLDSTYGAALDPQTLALLSAAAAGLEASGPSRTPTSFGQVMGRATNAGLGTYMGAFEANRKAAQTKALIDLEEQKLKQGQATFGLQQSIISQMGMPGNRGPVPQAPPPGNPMQPGGSIMAPPRDGGGGGVDMQPQPQAPQGHQFPFGLNQVTAMKIAGLPDILPNYKESQPDIKIEGGIIRDMRTGKVLGTQPIITPNGQAIQPQVGPDGKYSVSGVPGADEILRNYKRIESQEGTAPVTLADGRTVPSYLAPRPGVPSPTMAPTPAPAPQPMTPPKPTVPAAKVDPWATMPKIVTPTGIGQSTYQKGVAESQGQFAGKLSEKYGAQAEVADTRIALNNQALSLVDKADSGPLAAQQAEVKSYLVKYAGIPESSFANTPSATKALDKDLLNAATQKAKAQFGARMTQSEVMLMLSRGAPNVDMPKAAMKYLIQSDNAALGYQKQQAMDLGRYISNGGDPHQFEGWYSKNFPMTSSLSQVHLDTGKRPPLSSFNR